MEADADSVYLLDVREAHELELASINSAVHIPMREVASRLNEVPMDRRVVVMCHHGGRSAMVCRAMAAQGRERLYNLEGGIDKWSLQIDPDVSRY
jgi:rhodanese-related sulfurtransferase